MAAIRTIKKAAPVASRPIPLSRRSHSVSMNRCGGATPLTSALIGERPRPGIGKIARRSDAANTVEKTTVAFVDSLGELIALRRFGDDLARCLAERPEHVVRKGAQLNAVLVHQ